MCVKRTRRPRNLPFIAKKVSAYRRHDGRAPPSPIHPPTNDHPAQRRCRGRRARRANRRGQGDDDDDANRVGAGAAA